MSLESTITWHLEAFGTLAPKLRPVYVARETIAGVEYHGLMIKSAHGSWLRYDGTEWIEAGVAWSPAHWCEPPVPDLPGKPAIIDAWSPEGERVRLAMIQPITSRRDSRYLWLVAGAVGGALMMLWHVLSIVRSGPIN